MAESLEALEKTIIDNSERDSIFARLREIPENNKCIDCDKKNPKWASSNLGLFICMDCAGKHRQYGVAITFVRSITLDTWTKKQILIMEIGGNAKAMEYFKKNGAVTNNAIDYKNSIISKYKQELNKKVENVMRALLPQENKNPAIIKEQEIIKNTVIEEIKTQEDSKEKFVCNLQANSSQAKGFDVTFKKQNITFPTSKGKVQAKKISDIDFDKLTIDDQQYNKKAGPNPGAQMVSNENTIKFEDSESKNTYKPSSYNSTKSGQVNDKLEEMKKKNISHISSDVLFSKNETSSEDKINFSKFSNSTTSISSNQFYGKEENENEDKAYDKMEQVRYAVNAAGEKIKQWKENAGDYLKKIKQNWT